MNTLIKILGGIGVAVIAALIFALVFLVSWVFASVICYLGLNALAGFGFNFAQIIGIAVPVAYVAAGSVNVND